MRGAYSRAVARSAARQFVEGRVVAAGQHPATEVAAGRETVHPRDGVAVVVVAFEHLRHAVVDVVRAFRVAHDPRGLDRRQLERGFGDDAGEAHAAARRPERVRVGVGFEHARAAGGRDDAHAFDVVGERAMAELAVDVGCDRAADRDEARAGDHHREPTEGEQRAQQACRGSRRSRRSPCPSRRRSRARCRGWCTTTRRRRRSARRRRTNGRGRARSRRARSAP